MNKTAHSELHRLFLIETLPEPLTPASRHLQIFDSYIEGTRMRLRRIRDPYENEWTSMLQQRLTPAVGAEAKLVEMHLDGSEYSLFERFAGPEIRKNRYFHEVDLVMFTFDVYLGRLTGLTTAKVDFETREELAESAEPPFMAIEVTNDPFFAGESLARKDFREVEAEVECITGARTE